MSSHSESTKLKAEIDALLRIGTRPDTDVELAASLARFLTVLGNAYIEARCRELSATALRQFAGERVSLYVANALQKRFQNIKWTTLTGLFETLADPGRWSYFFNTTTDQERNQLNSLVTLRNSIAHGRSNSPSIATVRQYLLSADQILSRLKTCLSVP